MLAVIAWEFDRVGLMAYHASIDLRVLAPGQVRTKRERDLCERVNLIGATRTTLSEHVPAPRGSIAFFSSPVGNFGDRCLRINRTRFARYGIELPEYAESATYPIAVRGETLWTQPKKFKEGLPEAVRMAIVLCNRMHRKRQGFERWNTLGTISPGTPA